MRERWDEAINKIDEKYIAEAAQTHAKHAAKQHEAEQFEAEGERPTAITSAPEGKSGKGKIIGVCAAAAAVALIAIGGGVMMSRDDSILTGDTTTEVTSEATYESSETVEYTESGELAIGFSQNYNEGYIKFESPQKAAWLGLNGVVGDISDWSENEVFDYIDDMKNIDLADADFRQAHENLERNGYKLDLSQGASYFNSLAAEEDYNSQITLSYKKGEAQIMINIGQSGNNFNYIPLGDSGYRLKADSPGSSYLYMASGEDYSSVCVTGLMLQGGASYYAASLNSLWGNWIYCDISAYNCSVEELTDVLAGIVCGKDALTEKDFTHLELANYSSFASARYTTSMALTDYMYEELTEIVGGFAAADPEYDIARDEVSSAMLRLYMGDNCEGHYDYLRLHKTVESPVYPEYYYSLSDGNSTAYFEITKESYEAMDMWFALYAPTFIEAKVIAEDDMGNRTDPENGSYMVEDRNGGIYRIGYTENFAAVGDTLRIWFYGGVMESYPAQLNEIKAEKIYDIASDEKTLVPEGEEVGGYDADIYEEYFLGEWKECFGTSASYDWTQIFDYSSDYVDHYCCGELSDGYYLNFYSGGEPNFFFIPKEFPHSMFGYCGVDIYTNKRNAIATEYIFHAEIGNTLSGELNYFGTQELCDRMGGNFAEVAESMYADITDNEGRVWRFDQGYAGCPNDMHPYLKDYSQGGMAAYAEIYMEYYDIATYDMKLSANTVTQWYSHFIKLTENGYELIATLPCDSKGNVYPDSEYKSFSEDDLYGHGVTAVFSWAGTNENVVYPQIYVEDTNTRRILAQADIISPAMYTHGGSFHKDMYPIVQDVPLESGAAFAVLIPIGRDEVGDAHYYATFYSYDKINRAISLIGEAGMFCECLNADITTDRESNIVKILTPDHAVESYRIDLGSNTVELIESGNEDGTFTADISNAGTGKEYAVFGTAFAGKWSSGAESMELNLYSDMFSWSDPCYFYEDNGGYFMLADGRVWFIPKDDRNTMYYYENLSGSGTLAFDDADKVYSRSGALQGFYGGEGEMGWFGLLDFLYTSDDSGCTVDELFDIEITDENGNVWVRTSDRAVDWGGIYEGYVNGELVHFLKMQSKSHPETFRYFSFNFNITKVRAGELSYSDEHYSFNMGIFDTEELVTDYATAARTDAESIGHGYFVTETQFFTTEQDTYYAIRMMGNNQAQWLSYGEIFYNTRDFDGVEGYEKLCETNISDCDVSGNYFYRLYNRYDEEFNTTLWLMVYQSGQVVADIKVDDDGFVPMDAYMEIHGNETKWLFVAYHDMELEGQRYVVYDIADPAAGLTPMIATNIVSQGDGNLRVTTEDGRTLILGGETVTEFNG